MTIAEAKVPSTKTQVVNIDPDELLRPKGDLLKAVAGSDDRRFNTLLLNQVAQTLFLPDDATTEMRTECVAAAMVAVRAFQPRDEVEGMMAAQAVGCHHAAMECLRRVAGGGLPPEVASRLRRDAANLMRTMSELVDGIERKRGKGPQVVRVERVVVNQGGQAVVGNVAPQIGAGCGQEGQGGV
jgi:hypothetical protein